MANSILSPTAVTREALRILHQKCNFIGAINRQYDESFARSGAKVGEKVKIRLPNQYTVRSGAALSAQDTTETSLDLAVTTQKGVDMNFSSAELSLSLDDFSKRVLEPAVSVLAAAIEADALSMRREVYQQVNNHGQALTFARLLAGRKKLEDSLTPPANRTALLNTTDNADLVDALKGLFHDEDGLARQYREGSMGRTAGFEFYENTHLGTHTAGARGGTPLINGATADGATQIVTDGWTNSVTGLLKVGDIFEITGVNAVHPETKADLGVRQQFVVSGSDVNSNGSGQATIAVSPAIVASGPRQNVTAVPADNAPLLFASTAGSTVGQSLLFQEDAFTFATADLVMPRGVDWAAREVYDGISMRIVRQYDINADKFPTRLDILYGYKTLRPQLACRLANN
ncbi:MAG: hypothetical protein K1X35_09965 [Caulobacteraceae bacterium]|nr:hypothetical protein [Caulobacteraceae bacterium]